MATDEPQEEQVEAPAPEPTVRCESCGAIVEVKATETVHRKYLNRVFPETWCQLCIKSRDQSTTRTLTSKDDEPDY